MSRFRLAAAIALAACLPLVSIAPAQAAPSATAGLYGSQDPTFDGVFRQSLVILGMNAIGERQSPLAVTWLLNAQCADGSFQEFRADLSKPCDPVDTENFTGPDTNATAAAVAALTAVGTKPALAAAKRATAYLTGAQNADGGWAYVKGAPSEANSTGLVSAALRSVDPKANRAALTRANQFLATLLAPCGGPDGGGLAYQAGSKVNGSASAQAYLGIVGAFPIVTRELGANPTCGKNLQQKVGSYLTSTLERNGGLLPPSMGTDPDFTNTVNAVLGLTAAGVGKPAVTKAMTALRAKARDYALKGGAPVPGALGMLLLAARATGANAKSFGGVDLVKALKSSQRT